MRAQEEQDKQPKHILNQDLENDPYYIISIVLDHIHVTGKLTSPELALFLRDLYYRHYLYDSKNSEVENAFGTVIYRETENPFTNTPLQYILNEYTRNEIKKFFGYNFTEYLELNMYEVEVLKDQAERMKQELVKAMESAKKETIKTNKLDISQYDLDDDILNG